MRVALSGGIVLAVATFAILGALTVILLVGPASASPSPHPLCDVCAHDPFEEAGGERSVTVAFSADGTAQWRAEVEITDESLADEWRERPPRIEPRNGDPAVVTDDDRLVVTYRRADAVRPAAAGTLMTESLHRPASHWLANVHEFTVIAPDGYVVARAPGEAAVEGANATWTFDDARIGEGGGPELAGGRIVFAPEDATAPSIRSAAAVGAAVVGPGVLGVHPLYWLALYTGIGTTLAAAHYGRPPSERLGTLPLGIVAVTTGAIPVLVLVGYSGGSGGLPGPLATVVTGALTVLVGLVVGVVGLIGYAVAARSPAAGPW